MKFVTASLASVAVILVSPFMGQLQSFLRRSLTTRQYVLLFVSAFTVAVGAAILIAVRRIRTHRTARYGTLIAALGIGGGYMWAVATPYPEVNAVERVHFVEYGLIALLFYRAWRPAGDLSIIALPLLAAFMVGTLDEWLQWFIPVRVGEAHDVFLNLVSIGCGLMFAVALEPPDRFTPNLRPQTRKQAGIVMAVVWLVFAGFVSQVHLGGFVDLDDTVRFRSHYTAAQLDELQRDRMERWRTDPPRVLRRLSQEDQYLDEGLWHVRARNREDGIIAWRENLILERFFAPVLDTPTYASPDGNRWSAEQRANMEARIDPNAPLSVSSAEPYPIVTWSHSAFWAVVAGVTLACLALALIGSRQRTRGANSSY